MKPPIWFREFVQRALRVRLSRAQRVLFSVLVDGVHPRDLSADDRGLARQLFGDVESAEIPDAARTVIALLKGARMGGTYCCSLALLWLGLVVSLDSLAPGEVGYGVIVAPDKKTARQGLNYVRGAVEGTPELAALIISSGSDSLVLRRPDGHLIAFEVLAASAGGSSLRGRSYFGVLLDESSFFRDPETGVVNDLDLYRAVAPRIIPGGRLFVISTAWAARGLLWDLVEKNHGHPVSALAAIAPTMLVLPTERNRQAYEEESERDQLNADREFGCKPFDGTTVTFIPYAELIKPALTDLLFPPVLAEKGDLAVGALDTGFRRDPSGEVILRIRAGRLIVAELFELRPQKGAPLKPSVVLAQFAARLQAHGVTEVVADQHYIETVREHLGSKFRIIEHPHGNTGKAAVFTSARDALKERRVDIPEAYKRLANQLRDVQARPLPGGAMQITSPRRHGQHGDLASAFCAAVWLARRAVKRAERARPIVSAAIPSHSRWAGDDLVNRHAEPAPYRGKDYLHSTAAERLRRFLNDER